MGNKYNFHNYLFKNCFPMLLYYTEAGFRVILFNAIHSSTVFCSISEVFSPLPTYNKPSAHIYMYLHIQFHCNNLFIYTCINLWYLCVHGKFFRSIVKYNVY